MAFANQTSSQGEHGTMSQFRENLWLAPDFNEGSQHPLSSRLCVWEKNKRPLCRRYLWAADRHVMTRRPGIASHLSLEAGKKKMYKTVSRSWSNRSTPWLVSKNDNSCYVLLSWHVWWLWWWWCCCCRGLKILRSCSWNQMK